MQSPFQLYLDTNQPPSECDRSHIEQLLKGPLQKVHELDAEIGVLRQMLSTLITRKAEHEGFIAAHRAMLHPLRSLPEEVLRAIFEWCIPQRRLLPEMKDTGAIHYMSAEAAPMVLTWVCIRWRRVALEHCSLWAEPTVCIPHPLGDEDRQNEMAYKTADYLREWLSRSGNRPLRLTVKSSLALPTKGLDAIWGFSQAPRCDGKGCSWNLIQLHLFLLFNQDPEDFALFRDGCLASGSSIRAFTIQSANSPWIHWQSSTFITMPLQWSQLNVLNAPHISLTDSDARIIFSRTSALRSCHINIAGCQLSETHPPGDCLTLPHLISITFQCFGKIGTLFSTLHLPKLAVANLLIMEAPGNSLAALAQSCSGQLQHVKILANYITQSEMLQFLALTPDIQSLTLANYSQGAFLPLITDGFLAALSQPSPLPDHVLQRSPKVDRADSPASEERLPTFLCPRLRAFMLKIENGPRLSDSAILKFVIARAGADSTTSPQRLEELTIIDSRHNPQMDVIRELERENVDLCGMKISLNYKNQERKT
ncbi:hypothetical protein NMY22_g1516 [Coprinellus aureogranulatus]|nr:hypothetical protein NMY22_g1516 [Coprinellus aureogranulatus]